MKLALKDTWIIELKNDFPDHLHTIENLSDSIELIMELARDYYFCKHQIRMLKRAGKENLSLQYQETLDELKKELNWLLRKYSNKC